MKRLILSLGIIIGIVSCEKVVDIPLNEADQRIVVEAVGKNLEGGSYVLLSKTIGSTQSAESIERLSDASVVVIDEDGNEFPFEEDGTGLGRYLNDSFSSLPNTAYQLNVSYQGNEITSKTRTKTKPQIDSLSVFQSTEDFLGNPDTTNVLIYTVTDNPDETNFYRFVLWINGVRSNDIFIETDDLGNGLTYTSPFFGISFESQDSVYAELWSMNKENYDYFSALLSNFNQGGPFSAAPSDPPTNIEGGIGYFGVFMTDTMSIIIP